MRKLALIFTLLLGVIALSACGASQPRPNPIYAPNIGGGTIYHPVVTKFVSLSAADTLTASNGTWSHSPTSFTYQWEDCNSSGVACTNISGATSSTYTIQVSDVGDTIRVVVTAHNYSGSASAVSAATAIITGSGSYPSNTVLPTISGTPVQGDVLTAANGTWTGSPTSYSYQWQDCNSSGLSCSNISGATSSTYTLQSTDVGDTIVVVVTATNTSGSSSASSAATSVIGSSGGSGTTNCFAAPGACGFPDPNYNNVGPTSSCSGLTSFNGSNNLQGPSGPIPTGDYSVSGHEIIFSAGGTSGSPLVVQGNNIVGYEIYLPDISYITLNNDCVTFDGSLSPAGEANEYTIYQNEGGNHLTITNTSVTSPACGYAYISTSDPICETGWQNDNLSSGTNTLLNDDIFADAAENIGMGNNSTVENSFIISNGDEPNGHMEDEYQYGEQGIVIHHNVMLNPFVAQGSFYGDASQDACTNQFTFTDNLMAGGDRVLSECGNGGEGSAITAGTSSLVVTGNDFARCEGGSTESPGTAPYYNINYCGSTLPRISANVGSSGYGQPYAYGTSEDTHGFYPDGGSYNLDFDIFCESSGLYASNGSVTWSGNYWDDTGATAPCE